MKYFANITTLDALKAEYRRLVLKHHPDCGGDTETMKRSMNEIRSKYGSQLFTADGESSGYARIGATA